MKKRIVLFITFALAIILLSIFFTLQYDIYSYHLWAYTAIKEGTHEVYNTAKYFDRACDYTHIGAYICEFQGKLLSYFNPLMIGSVPQLFFYKILPLIFLLFFLGKTAFSEGNKRMLLGYILALPAAVSIIVNGQFDIIILFLLLAAVGELEKKNRKMGLFLLFIALLVKQTAVFFVILILLHYFLKSESKRRFVKNSLITGGAVCIAVMLPFIIKGNVVDSIRDLFYNTFASLPFSGHAFNALSIFNPGDRVDHNYNVLGLSLRFYSLLLVMLSTAIVAVIKDWDIFRKMALFSLLWFNFLLGLREQHLIYPCFFISIYMLGTGKSILYSVILSLLTIANITMYNPSVAYLFFRLPYLPEEAVRVMSVIFLILSTVAAVAIAGGKRHSKRQSELIVCSRKEARMILALMFALIFFAEFAPGFIRSGERELFSDAMINKKLVDFSKDRYIDLNVITLSPFENYLGARMSDGAFFKIANDGKYSELILDARMEFVDRGAIIVNGESIEIDGSVKDAKVNVGGADTIIIESISPKKFSQVGLYNVRVK